MLLISHKVIDMRPAFVPDNGRIAIAYHYCYLEASVRYARAIGVIGDVSAQDILSCTYMSGTCMSEGGSV